MWPRPGRQKPISVLPKANMSACGVGLPHTAGSEKGIAWTVNMSLTDTNNPIRWTVVRVVLPPCGVIDVNGFPAKAGSLPTDVRRLTHPLSQKGVQIPSRSWRRIWGYRIKIRLHASAAEFLTGCRIGENKLPMPRKSCRRAFG